MLGGLATLAAFALVDALVRRSVAAWRAFVFVALTGAASVLLTGLTQTLLPGLPLQTLHTLQNSLGLLSGALALSYLGLWMGVAAEDRVVRLCTRAGSAGLILAAATMAILTVLSPPQRSHDLLAITAAINGLAVLLPAVAATRAITLGDRLAWGILAATVLLAFMVAGLYARALHVDGFGVGAALFTALNTVAFFMLGTYLGLRRDRLIRRLERLAGLSRGDDKATGLPKGSVLLSKVDDAFWRGARKSQECTVICLHVHNLYALAETAGHQSDQQILSAMSARLRRAVGFRNVVGLYHPRCFVVVISTENKTRLVEKTLQRLRYLMAKPLHVTGHDGSNHAFVPTFGIGSVPVTSHDTSAVDVIDHAERLAVADETGTDGHTEAPIALL